MKHPAAEDDRLLKCAHEKPSTHTSSYEVELPDAKSVIPTQGPVCAQSNSHRPHLPSNSQKMTRTTPPNLKAYPHLESKLKKWKESYGIVYDLSNTSGFAWNDNRKCIEVDSNDAWDTYVQHNKSAKGWRNKSYPIYDRLAAIFGKDRANGKGAEVPADMTDVQSNNDANLEHVLKCPPCSRVV